MLKHLMKRIEEQAEEGRNFGELFCFTTGYLEQQAEFDPKVAYTASEITELFDLLFEIREAAYKAETPAVAAAGESN